MSLGYDLTLPRGDVLPLGPLPDDDDYAFAMSLAERGVIVLPGSASEGPGYLPNLADRDQGHDRAEPSGLRRGAGVD